MGTEPYLKAIVSNNLSGGLSSEQLEDQALPKIAIMGCGYVGRSAASYWRKKGYVVTGTTTRNELVSELENMTTQVMVMTGDDPQAVQSMMQHQDTILVSVAPISDRQVDAETYAKTYLPTARNIVLALKNTPTVRQVIYLSSCSVYGDKKGEWTDETSSVNTDSDYGKVLNEAENILLNLERESVKIGILRLGGIYGPGRELTKRLGRFAGKHLPGSGGNWSNWIHLDDIVGAIDFLRQNRCQGIYNLVNDMRLISRDLCDIICDRQGLPKVLWDDSQPSFSSLNARIDNSKIKSAGYQFIHPDTIV